MKNGLEIIPVSHANEVLKHALVRQPEPIEWTEPAHVPSSVVEDEAGAQIAH